MLKNIITALGKPTSLPWFYLYIYPKLKGIGVKNIEKYLSFNSIVTFLLLDNFPLLNILPDPKKVSDFLTLAFLVDKISDEARYKISKEDLRTCSCKNNTSCSLTMKEICNILKESNLSEKAYKKFLDCIVTQNNSMQQFHETREEKLFELSTSKGGVAMQFFILFFRDASEDELEDAYLLGSLIQLLEDYIDRDEDKKEGINTLFSLNYWNKRDLIKFASELMKSTNLLRYRLLFLKSIIPLYLL